MRCLSTIPRFLNIQARHIPKVSLGIASGQKVSFHPESLRSHKEQSGILDGNEKPVLVKSYNILNIRTLKQPAVIGSTIQPHNANGVAAHIVPSPSSQKGVHLYPVGNNLRIKNLRAPCSANRHLSGHSYPKLFFPSKANALTPFSPMASKGLHFP